MVGLDTAQHFMPKLALAAGETVVEDRLRDVGPGGDRRHRCGGVARLGEHVQGGVEHRAPAACRSDVLASHRRPPGGHGGQPYTTRVPSMPACRWPGSALEKVYRPGRSARNPPVAVSPGSAATL